MRVCSKRACSQRLEAAAREDEVRRAMGEKIAARRAIAKLEEERRAERTAAEAAEKEQRNRAEGAELQRARAPRRHGPHVVRRRLAHAPRPVARARPVRHAAVEGHAHDRDVAARRLPGLRGAAEEGRRPRRVARRRVRQREGRGLRAVGTRREVPPRDAHRRAHHHGIRRDEKGSLRRTRYQRGGEQPMRCANV